MQKDFYVGLQTLLENNLLELSTTCYDLFSF